jgi:hypothetical protein
MPPQLINKRNACLQAFAALVCITVASCLLAASSPHTLDNAPNLTEDEEIALLQHAKVINGKHSKTGITSPWDLTLSDGRLTYLASFQPVHEAKALKQFADGQTEINFKDFWEYNIAGYRIAKLLGLGDMVPVYTERRWNGMRGSISFYIPNVQFNDAYKYEHKIKVPAAFIDSWNKQMYKVRVLTQLFYDTDTNLTNVLITKDWKIWRIDFSRAFRLYHNLKNPNDLVQCDHQLLTKLRELSYDQVLEVTKPYLTPDEVKALIERRDMIVAAFEKLIAEKGEGAVLY